jgi:hypothetical protein
MNATKLLLNTYYEALHDMLEANKELLNTKIEKLLHAEFAGRDFGKIGRGKFDAYRDACIGFVDERIEMYNPIGIQYTYDGTRRQQAFEVELQLNFYDSRGEFEALVEAAQAKVETDMSEQRLRESAEELIKEVGAFPDKSIIAAYEDDPALNKLPDYIVARAIEEIITST